MLCSRVRAELPEISKSTIYIATIKVCVQEKMISLFTISLTNFGMLRNGRKISKTECFVRQA